MSISCSVNFLNRISLSSEAYAGANTDETKSCIGGVDFVTLVLYDFMLFHSSHIFLVISGLKSEFTY